MCERTLLGSSHVQQVLGCHQPVGHQDRDSVLGTQRLSGGSKPLGSLKKTLHRLSASSASVSLLCSNGVRLIEGGGFFPNQHWRTGTVGCKNGQVGHTQQWKQRWQAGCLIQQRTDQRSGRGSRQPPLDPCLSPGEAVIPIPLLRQISDPTIDPSPLAQLLGKYQPLCFPSSGGGRLVSPRWSTLHPQHQGVQDQ